MSNLNYVYRDHQNVLHVTDEIQPGYNCKPIDFPCSGGFPVIDGEKVFDNGDHTVFIGGNKPEDGRPLTPEQQRQMKPLYKALGEGFEAAK